MIYTTKISIAIPIGPNKHHAEWLDECLLSLVKQEVRPSEIIIVDDMHDIKRPRIMKVIGDSGISLKIFRSPWRLGVAHAFNFGVALATNNLVITLGADDTLEPECVQECWLAYNHTSEPKRDLTYFYLGVKYMDTGETQRLPCQAAMVSKYLWKYTGGLPTECATGASDAAFISIMMANKNAGWLIPVNDNKPLYNYRRHNLTDTASKGPWQGVILSTRDRVTQDWKQPDWGRYHE